MKNLRICLTVCFVIVCLALSAKTIRYVKANASGDGTSWANASGNVQAMIDNSVEGDEVWVAKGTYYPTTETIARDARSRSFVVKNGVKFYGGFAGTETTLSQRALADLDANGKIDSFELVNQTTLSGDFDGAPDVWSKTINSDSTWTWSVAGNSGNCYSVVTGEDKFLIDGFYVKGATKGGISAITTSLLSTISKCSVTECMGSGIYTASFVTNCYVTKCSEGGIFSKTASQAQNKPVVLYCTVTHCSSTDGGGIYNSAYGCLIDKCVVSNCSATVNGGGIYGAARGCTISNCISSGEGGGIAYYYQDIDSCIVTGCKASYGGGIKCNVGVRHCVVSNCESKVIGGGIWGDVVSDCNVSKCRSDQNGGGIWSANQVTSKVYNCTVSNCSSRGFGGGIYGNMINDCAVSSCSSSDNGGGIYVSAAITTDNYYYYREAFVRNCVVKNCFSGNSGGGIFSFFTTNYGYIYGVSNCLVSNCSSNMSGGGISSIGAVNCTVTNCTAANAGGIKSLYDMREINCAIVNCSSSGSTGGSDAGHLTNCAFSNNSSNGIIGAGVKNDIIGSYISPDISETFVRPTSFIGVATTEPQKAEILTADWHLKKGSPCVNAGGASYSNIGIDLENHNRLLYGTIDIGAYEYETPAILIPSFEYFDQTTKWENSNLFFTSALQTKWQIVNQKALFDWHTNLTSYYSESFFTYPMDATNLSSVFLRYDLYFEAYAGSISTLGTEKLNVEFSTDMSNWASITAFSNANGTIANKTYKHDISTLAAGKKFFIRFSATGENSNRIEKWEVDNVIVDIDGTSGISSLWDSKLSCVATNGTLTLYNLAASSTIQLLDVNGKLLSNSQATSSSYSIPLPHRGVYLVKVNSGSRVETKKLVW